MSPQVMASVIRLATHPRVFARPDRLDDVVAFASTVLDQPHCQIIQPGPRHWGIFTALCHSANAYGNLVQDAWLAALAIESAANGSPATAISPGSTDCNGARP